MASRPDIIFHLAAIVSGEAEADFEKGYRINLDGTRFLFDAIRACGRRLYAARGVYLVHRGLRRAVSGCDRRRILSDAAHELRHAEGDRRTAAGRLYRRGFFDGVGIRLPTICVRPGKPNKAASGFFSSIIREPLNGQEAVLPVPETSATPMPHRALPLAFSCMRRPSILRRSAPDAI